jgi:hypothetical protein
MTSKTRARRRGGVGAGGHGKAKDEGGMINKVEADDDWFTPLVTAFTSCPLSHLPRRLRGKSRGGQPLLIPSIVYVAPRR